MNIKHTYKVGGIFSAAFLFFILVFVHNVDAVDIKKHTINVQKNAHIVKTDSDTNYGNESKIKVEIDELVDHEQVCALIQFEDDILPDNSAAVDSADFEFTVLSFPHSQQVHIDISPLTSDWNEKGVTWSNVPGIDNRYTKTTVLFLGKEEYFDITEIVRAWVDGDIANYGIKICYKAGEKSSEFSFNSREGGWQAPKLITSYYYPNIALGNPVDMQDVGVQYIDDMAVVNIDANNIDNSQNVISLPKEIIKLREPKDGETLNTASPLFKWKYLNTLPKDTEPAIVVEKDDGQKWEALIEDKKDTVFSRDDGFENGSYKWHMEILKDARVIQKTENVHFKIDASDIDRVNRGVQPQPQNSVSQNIAQNKSVQEQPKQNITQNKKIEDKIEPKAKSDVQAEENQDILLWGILIGVSTALLILIIVLGIIWYNHKKDKIKEQSKGIAELKENNTKE